MTLEKSRTHISPTDQEMLDSLAKIEGTSPEKVYSDCRESSLGEKPKQAYPLGKFLTERDRLIKKGPKSGA